MWVWLQPITGDIVDSYKQPAKPAGCVAWLAGTWLVICSTGDVCMPSSVIIF